MRVGDGVGFEIAVSDEGLIKFFKNHEKTLKTFPDGRRALAYIEQGKDNPKEDLFDSICDVSGMTGVYAIISNTMHKETGVRFEYYYSDDEDQDDIIVFPSKLPYEYSELEKALTKNDLIGLVQKYVDELNSYGSLDLTVFDR